MIGELLLCDGILADNNSDKNAFYMYPHLHTLRIYIFYQILQKYSKISQNIDKLYLAIHFVLQTNHFC